MAAVGELDTGSGESCFRPPTSSSSAACSRALDDRRGPRLLLVAREDGVFFVGAGLRAGLLERGRPVDDAGRRGLRDDDDNRFFLCRRAGSAPTNAGSATHTPADATLATALRSAATSDVRVADARQRSRVVRPGLRWVPAERCVDIATDEPLCGREGSSATLYSVGGSGNSSRCATFSLPVYTDSCRSAEDVASRSVHVKNAFGSDTGNSNGSNNTPDSSDVHS